MQVAGALDDVVVDILHITTFVYVDMVNTKLITFIKAKRPIMAVIAIVYKYSNVLLHYKTSGKQEHQKGNQNSSFPRNKECVSSIWYRDISNWY